MRLQKIQVSPITPPMVRSTFLAHKKTKSVTLTMFACPSTLRLKKLAIQRYMDWTSRCY